MAPRRTRSAREAAYAWLCGVAVWLLVAAVRAVMLVLGVAVLGTALDGLILGKWPDPSGGGGGEAAVERAD